MTITASLSEQDSIGHEGPYPDRNEGSGVCDTHVHVYDDSYTVSRSAVLRPPNASLADYRTVRTALGIRRVVLVQPTTYGLDNSCQIDAAASVGDAARLVVVVDDMVTEAELDRLTSLGARGARFHMLPGGTVPWSILHPVAERVAPFGWHIQLQLDGRELPDRITELRRLPTPLVVDHVGRFMPPVSPGHHAFRALLTLIDDGRCWVKLAAPYESTCDGAPHYPTVTALAHRLIDQAPERMLWATNWPHPGQTDPITIDQLRALRDEWLPNDRLRRRVLVDNPAEVYGYPSRLPSSDSTPHQETP